MKTLKFLGTCLAVGGTLGAHGQATLNAAGGQAVVSGTTQEWSVGEMPLIETYTAGSLVVTQGVLQPAPPPTGVAALPMLTGQLQVYPNPAANHLFLKHDFPQAGTLTCQLLDVTGKRVSRTEHDLASGSGTHQLSLQGLAAGSYLLQVQFTDRSRNESAAVYTIQKTN